jgi:very-short-patch-repair endonuclease
MSLFEETCKAVGLPKPTAEYKFHPERKWRIDYAFPEFKLGVEQEGAVWAYGRHNRAAGFIKDMEKYNAAAEIGWRILRYQPNKIDYDQIKRTYEVIKNGKF